MVTNYFANNDDHGEVCSVSMEDDAHNIKKALLFISISRETNLSMPSVIES